MADALVIPTPARIRTELGPFDLHDQYELSSLLLCSHIPGDNVGQYTQNGSLNFQ